MGVRFGLTCCFKLSVLVLPDGALCLIAQWLAVGLPVIGLLLMGLLFD